MSRQAEFRLRWQRRTTMRRRCCLCLNPEANIALARLLRVVPSERLGKRTETLASHGGCCGKSSLLVAGRVGVNVGGVSARSATR